MNLLKWRTTSAPGAESEAPPAEHRGYSDVVTNALIAAASDALSDGYVSGLEIAAGQLSRAFATARLTGSGARYFNPWVLAQLGRSLVEEGEAVWFRIGRKLERGINYSLTPERDVYEFSLAGRTGIFVRPASQVLHVRWSLDTASERGVSPLSAARTLRTLSMRLENALATESNASIGYLLPVPTDGDTSTVQQLKQDLAGLKGRIAVVETTRGGWGEGTGGAPRRDFELARLGPDYPDSSIRLFKEANERVLAACGYPVQLVQTTEGTGQREAWRRYLHGTVAPLGRLVETAAAAIGIDVGLDFDSLFASDVQGRARAFQSLVNGGMPLEAAAAASGILTPPEDD